MARQSDSLPPDRAGSPSSLIVTFAGCYLRQIGGWISVANLIALLEPVGVDAPAVRGAVRRLKSRGFFAPERRGGAAGYALTPEGRADLSSGDTRIFRFGRADLTDGWILAVFSVPESERSRRHRLRSLLGWLGFGSITAGVWVAPAALADTARDLIASGNLARYVTWFHASALDPPSAEAWWDLDSLGAHYTAFAARWQGRVAGAGAADSDSRCFADYLALVDEWRLFPRTDPGLPTELLPRQWPGPRAWDVFSTLRSAWEAAGLRHTRWHTAARAGRQPER